MKQEVKLGDIRAIKMGIQYKPIKDSAKTVDDTSEGELITVITLEVALQPEDIAKVAKMATGPEALTVVLESKQAVLPME